MCSEKSRKPMEVAPLAGSDIFHTDRVRMPKRIRLATFILWRKYTNNPGQHAPLSPVLGEKTNILKLPTEIQSTVVCACTRLVVRTVLN